MNMELYDTGGVSPYLYLLVLSIFINTITVATNAVDYCKLCDAPGTHTMCLYPKEGPSDKCVKYEKRPITTEEKQLIVDLHNKWRNEVALGRAKSRKGNFDYQPHAANMRQLSWDEELQQIAQRWADQCRPFFHPQPHDKCKDSARFRVGQNIVANGIASNKIMINFTASTMEWYNEIDHYDPAWVTEFKGSPNPENKIGHYTQLVWGTSYKIGCGLAIFSDTIKNLTWKIERLVCNYGPGGNILAAGVYKIGEPCSKCPQGTQCSSVYKGLCSSTSEIEQSVVTAVENLSTTTKLQEETQNLTTVRKTTSEATKKLPESTTASTEKLEFTQDDISKQTETTKKTENMVKVEVVEKTTTATTKQSTDKTKDISTKQLTVKTETSGKTEITTSKVSALSREVTPGKELTHVTKSPRLAVKKPYEKPKELTTKPVDEIGKLNIPKVEGNTTIEGTQVDKRRPGNYPTVGRFGLKRKYCYCRVFFSRSSCFIPITKYYLFLAVSIPYLYTNMEEL